jgi:hypothetical protein
MPMGQQGHKYSLCTLLSSRFQLCLCFENRPQHSLVPSALEAAVHLPPGCSEDPTLVQQLPPCAWRQVVFVVTAKGDSLAAAALESEDVVHQAPCCLQQTVSFALGIQKASTPRFLITSKH